MESSVRQEPLNILLVEDNPADVTIAEEVLARLESPTVLNTVPDGVEALKYLAQIGEYAEAKRPDVVWLDLKLPYKGGHEVLNEIRQDPRLTTLPVVILSSSNHRVDVQRSYALHANCYFVKAVELSEYAETLASLVDFWGRRAVLPFEERN